MTAHGTARGRVRTGVETTAPPPDTIRNVVVVGHSAAGKTTLLEALLAETGAVNRAGRVEDGSTVCDHEPIERRLGRSVCLAVASTHHDGATINLIDTPGHPDFVGEVRAGLRAADAALFVISAVDGVDTTTRMLWTECAAIGMPRAVVITHVDQQRGDFAESLATCRQSFGDGIQPIYLPVADRDGPPTGLFSLLSHQVSDISPDRVATAESARAELIEAIIQESEDDTLLDRWIAGEEIGLEILIPDLERAVARGSFYPVLPTVASAGLGIAELLEIIVRGFPSPLEHPLPVVTTPDGEPLPPLRCDVDGPLVAEVLKTTTDPYVGQVSILRIFSGRLAPDDMVHVCGRRPVHDADERAGAMSRLLGATLVPVTAGTAGDILAVARLSRAVTGDTLSDPATPALMEPWPIPDPMLPTAVVARTSAAEDKLSQALVRLNAEDPAVRVYQDPDTHQLVLWAMGDSHLDVVLDRLSSRHGVEVDAEPIRVPLRETLRDKATGHGRHVKQSGGHGQYAVCDVEVEPLPQGSGFEFVDRVVGGAVPRQYIPSVEKGIRAQMERGVAGGYPMVDLRVTLVGGKAHSVDSSDAAFQVAGALALKEAAASAGVAMLEPVDLVQIVVDDEFVGAVLGDVSARRGRVTGTSSVADGRTEISAEVPEIELITYAQTLRGLAHGSGLFSRSYLRHAPMPQDQAEQVLKL
ncbi:MAG TPA: elongation factor G-like protein EF-G2 [Kineosporiaceae bacterium]|nr:elongation factor G-like protein EF-G2 [Kineosporiaceae bacterium]